jgi:preprotein translocase subunit Sec61beta
MAQEGGMYLPGSGGLTRFNEEYESKLMLKPIHVVVLIIAIIVLRVALPYIF